MTALPLQPPRLLTVAEFAALPEATEGRFELQEGRLVISPSPLPRHQRCQHRVQVQLDPQLPPGLCLLPAVDVDLGLAGPNEPGFVRIPDLAVVTDAEYERADREGGPLRAAHVQLVVEILSGGSQRTDRVIKHGEYADAGIGHYWILDLMAQASRHATWAAPSGTWTPHLPPVCSPPNCPSRCGWTSTGSAEPRVRELTFSPPPARPARYSSSPWGCEEQCSGS